MRRRLANPLFAALAAAATVIVVVVVVGLAAGWFDDEGGNGNGNGDGGLAELPATPAQPEDGAGLTARQIYDRAAPGVTFIKAEGLPERPPVPLPIPQQPRVATGSGFVIDDEGRVITNAHVVEGARTVTVNLGEESEALEAEVVGTDPSTDLALLDVEADAGELDPIPLGDSSEVQVGEPVVAIGNPLGLERTATAGIVSALNRQIAAPNGFTITDVIQTDAPINPGNSGGPLIDGRGEVIGINSQIATAGGRGSIGIGFAVPSDTAREVVEELLTEGEVQQPFLGVNGADINDEIANLLDLPTEEGVLVQDVVPNSPADEAGIRGGQAEVITGATRLLIGGDIIVRAGDQEIAGMEDLIEVIEEREPGDTLTLTIIRDGERRQLTAELADRPQRLGQSG